MNIVLNILILINDVDFTENTVTGNRLNRNTHTHFTFIYRCSLIPVNCLYPKSKQSNIIYYLAIITLGELEVVLC